MAAPPDVVKKIEDGFAKLQAAEDCKSLLKKHLTKAVVDKLKRKKTRLGATLLDVIQSGVENLDSGVGLYAPDAEAYTMFADLFNPVIEEYHNGFKATDSQPPMDLGEKNLGELTNLDPENKFIVSTRIRCGRSLAGYPFNPCLTEANYKNMEKRMQDIFKSIKDDELKVLGRLIKGLNFISTKAPFARHPRLGWLTFCPTNLGTTVRASVHIKLPKVSAKPEFKQICSDMKLQIRGIHGEHSESAEGIYDISNKQRLGLTEYQAVRQMYDGVKKLIEMETAEG
ncbi:hypothetical protein GCK32_003024 [Trichostrongylus colubriformis]|uniref:arginine kinase n=1 Tax=Trichostrongylus colubriformis TaxID=6319 RepID=A0AAN8EXE7_TRICO